MNCIHLEKVIDIVLLRVLEFYLTIQPFWRRNEHVTVNKSQKYGQGT